MTGHPYGMPITSRIGAREKGAARPMVIEDPCHQLPDISDALSAIEGRLLGLVKDMEQGLVSLEDFTSILSGMLAELKRWYRQVVEKGELRTIDFRTVRMLRELDETLLYLYRKIRLEQMFFTKLAIEKKLRRFLSTEAFDLYEQLQDVAESEKALSAGSDGQVRYELLGKDGASSPLPPV